MDYPRRERLRDLQAEHCYWLIMRICNKVTGTVADVRDDFVLYGDWVEADGSRPVPQPKPEPVAETEPEAPRKPTGKRRGVKSRGVQNS